MGTYVYALNTKVRNISNVTVGVAEYRYKPSWNDRDNFNQRMYNRLCARRVAHFEKNKLPFFFVLSKLEVGSPVYSHLTKDNRLVGSCFDDNIQFNKVGTIKKNGRSYEIDWI